jgi:3-deoxy-7-phosphoheptulonate synthase
VFGVMVESHIKAGNQKFNPGADDVNKLEYGQSITDACIDWEHSVQLLQTLADAVQVRRKVKV